MKRHVKATLAIAAVAGFCNSAFASFLYDFEVPGNGELKFSESILVTSLTTVTNFLVDAVSVAGIPVDTFIFNPTTAGGNCFIVASPACFRLEAGVFSASVGSLADFSTVGTHSLIGRITMIITASTAPEPSPLVLLLTALAASLVKRIRGGRSAN